MEEDPTVAEKEALPETPPLKPQELADKPCCSKCWRLGILVVGLLLAGSIAYAGYQFSKKQVPPVTTPKAQITPLPTADPTANWQTYTNEKLKFLFKYPAEWEPTIEESMNSPQKEIALAPYLNISTNFVGGWMGKNVREEKVNIGGIKGTVALWLGCSSNIAQEWENCNSQLSLSQYDYAILRAQFDKGDDKWIITFQGWKKGERDENTELNKFKLILSTFKFKD